MFSSFENAPFVRFADKFYYLTQNNAAVLGYDCRFFLILDGTVSICIGGENYVLEKFDLCYIPPAVPYLFENGKRLKLIVINFDFSQNGCARASVIPPTPSVIFHASDVTDLPPKEFSKPFVLRRMENMQELFETLLRERFFADECSARMSSLLLEQILLRCFRARNTQISLKDQQLLQKIMGFLDEHATEKLCESALAESLNYHPYYLNRVFKQGTGQTIHAYIVRKRVRLAADLLLSESCKCEEIAERVGMPNHAHFIKTFRRYMGTTPALYRKTPPL